MPKSKKAKQKFEDLIGGLIEDVQEQRTDEKNNVSELFQKSESKIQESKSPTHISKKINLGQNADKPKTEAKRKTGSKAVAENKESQPLVNRNGTVTEPSSNRNQILDQPSSNRNEFAHKNASVPKPETQPSSNRHQTVTEPSSNRNEFSLTGLARKLVEYLCLERLNTGELETPPITSEVLIKALECSAGGLRNIISELKRKGNIEVRSLKKGRHGLRIFKVNDDIYREMIKGNNINRNQTVMEPSLNRNQTVISTVIKPSSETNSSSEVKNKKLLLSSSAQKIGITENIANQLSSFMDQEEFDEVLRHLEFDILKGKKFIGPPGNMLLGIYRKGLKYQSPELTMKEAEALEKEIKAIQLAQKALEEAKFKKWREEVRGEEQALVEPSQFAKSGSRAHESLLRQYFVENILNSN